MVASQCQSCDSMRDGVGWAEAGVLRPSYAPTHRRSGPTMIAGHAKTRRVADGPRGVGQSIGTQAQVTGLVTTLMTATCDGREIWARGVVSGYLV